jgi:hypothetical protein
MKSDHLSRHSGLRHIVISRQDGLYDAFAVRKRLGDLYRRYATKYSGFNPQLKGRITPAMRGGLKLSLELTNGTPPESSATGE